MKNIFKILLFSLVTSLLFTACGGGGTSGGNSNTSPIENTNFTGDGNIEFLMQKNLEKYDIPAMAVVTVSKDVILETAVVGKKSYGEEDEVSSDDLWNIGSVTKSMTATLAAIMVNQGYLTWDTKILEVFPEFEQIIQPEYQNLTLIELLSHTSGFPSDNDELWEEYIEDDDPVELQRYEFTQGALAYELESFSKSFQYSNINYVVASAMLEKVSGLSFEDLIQSLLFEPLAMNDTQIGTENLAGNIQGHIFENNKWVSKKASDIDSSNVAIVAPAGSQTYLSITNIGKYLQLHLQGKLGIETGLIGIDNFNTLHTKITEADEDLGYALGWYTESDYGLQHSGSNGRWFAVAFINSEKQYGYCVVVNGYKDGVENGVFEMLQTLIKRSDELGEL